jgi:hypothetical protein
MVMLPDPYKGWTAKQLKQRCRELCRSVDGWQQIAMAVSEHGKESLSPSERERLDGLIEAYRD